MQPEVVTATSEPETDSPEAVLRFLSEHRQRAVRGRKQNRWTGGRTWKKALLGLVAAVALAGASVLVYGKFASPGTSRTAPPATGAQAKGNTRSSSAAPRSSRPEKPRKTAARLSADETWHRGLQPWPESTGRRGSGFYYRWKHSHVSCAGYATNGCWNLEVVARHGCPHGVMMVVEETENGATVGAAWGFGRRLAAKSVGVVEVDADREGVGGRVHSMACRP